MARLKVFCTSSGFYDSIVAAPSRAAALRAWGAKTDLFSMGAAALVTDTEVAKKALERPGEVIRVRRSPVVEPGAKGKQARKARRPSRKRLEAAERGLAELEAAQAEERAVIDREIRSLEKKRAELEKRHGRARASAKRKLDRASDAYDEALDRWRD